LLLFHDYYLFIFHNHIITVKSFKQPYSKLTSSCFTITTLKDPKMVEYQE